MITYVIGARIAPMVRSGLVRQVLRAAQVRCPSRGDRIALIDARQTEVIPDPVVTAVHAVDIGWDGRSIARMRQGGIPVLHLDKLAQACGHDCIDDLAKVLWWFDSAPTSAFIVEWAAPELMMAEVA